MTKPIRPEDIAKTQKETFPPEVFAAFNELIAENYCDGMASFSAGSVEDRIRTKLKLPAKFRSGYLNAEEAYRSEGWHVTFIKDDGYGMFTFTKARPLTFGPE